MYKIKIIGPKDLIAPLKILGLETYFAENENEAKHALNSATEKKEPSLIFLSERLAVDLPDEIEVLNQYPELNIILIPDNRGGIGISASKIQSLIKHAVGAEIITRR